MRARGAAVLVLASIALTACGDAKAVRLSKCMMEAMKVYPDNFDRLYSPPPLSGGDRFVQICMRAEGLIYRPFTPAGDGCSVADGACYEPDGSLNGWFSTLFPRG